jgi:hypothetical protein
MRPGSVGPKRLNAFGLVAGNRPAFADPGMHDPN